MSISVGPSAVRAGATVTLLGGDASSASSQNAGGVSVTAATGSNGGAVLMQAGAGGDVSTRGGDLHIAADTTAEPGSVNVRAQTVLRVAAGSFNTASGGNAELVGGTTSAASVAAYPLPPRRRLATATAELSPFAPARQPWAVVVP